MPKRELRVLAETKVIARAATLTAQGRVRVPQEILDALDVKVGDQLVFATAQMGTAAFVTKLTGALPDFVDQYHRTAAQALAR